MAQLMGRRKSHCCPGHDVKYHHRGTQRARERRTWYREAAAERAASAELPLCHV